MKRKYNNLLLLLFVIVMGCASTSVNTGHTGALPATALKPFGRYIINKGHNLELISSAVHFGFSFEGSQCAVYASLPGHGGHNYLQYEMDGEYQKKIRIEGKSTAAIVLTAPKSGRHMVWIYKTTEAHTGAIIISKVTGKNIKALERPAAATIEFIGNSITCGAAADASEISCETGEYHDHHDAYHAYGPTVARALNANYIISSVSGIGVYRNWNSDAPAMPQVYEKADFQQNNLQKWNFENYNPQVVSIALGTNDFSRGDGIKKRLAFDSAVFITEYVKFVQLVKSKYPTARIALLSSPMMSGKDRLLLQACITSIKKKVDVLDPSGKKLVWFFFEQMQAHGCTGHPSVEDHAVLAKQLIPFFKNLLQ